MLRVVPNAVPLRAHGPEMIRATYLGGLGIKGLGIRVEGLGFRGLGFRVYGLGIMDGVQGVQKAKYPSIT